MKNKVRARCINAEGYLLDLTIGKVYEIDCSRYYNHCLPVDYKTLVDFIGDRGYKNTAYMRRFITICNITKLKIL